MEKPILKDPEQHPTEEIIFSNIGDNKKHWQALFKELHEKYPGFEEQWRYYKDGYAWLLKIVKKKKTVMWVAVFDGFFNTTFYFGEKAEPVIMSSDLPENLKEQYRTNRYGKIRGVTVTPHSAKDIKDVFSLVTLRLSIK